MCCLTFPVGSPQLIPPTQLYLLRQSNFWNQMKIGNFLSPQTTLVLAKVQQRSLFSVYREVFLFFPVLCSIFISVRAEERSKTQVSHPWWPFFYFIHDIRFSLYTLCANLHSLTSNVPTHPVQWDTLAAVTAPLNLLFDVVHAYSFHSTFSLPFHHIQCEYTQGRNRISV